MISKKTKLIFKIIISILMAISMIVGGFFLYFVSFKNDNVPYFFEHFALFVSLLCIGIVALLLPAVTNSRFMGNGKDNIMILVGFALIICGLVAIIYSYMV